VISPHITVICELTSAHPCMASGRPLKGCESGLPTIRPSETFVAARASNMARRVSESICIDPRITGRSSAMLEDNLKRW
jgi:hypothetical protein